MGTLFLRLESCWRRDLHFPWSPEPREGLAVCRAKGVPSILSYFKTLSIGPAPGIEPATFRSAVKRSTDWAYPAAVLNNGGQLFKTSHKLCERKTWCASTKTGASCYDVYVVV